jgi:ParB-like nuclease domain
MNYNEWVLIEVDPNDILLDKQNPRFISDYELTQENMIELIETQESLISLFKNISTNGYNKAEPIVIVEENGRKVVIEGNRRITACKLLKNRNRLKDSFVKIPNPYPIDKIPAVLVPDRKQALAYIVSRHVSGGVELWSVEARRQLFAKLMREGVSVNEAALLLGLSLSQVNKSIRENKLFEYVKNLQHWTPEELVQFTEKISPLFYFFERTSEAYRKNAKELIGFNFNKNHDIEASGSKEELDTYLYEISKRFLLSPRKYNTRTKVDMILSEIGHPLFAKPISSSESPDFINTENSALPESFRQDSETFKKGQDESVIPEASRVISTNVNESQKVTYSYNETVAAEEPICQEGHAQIPLSMVDADPVIRQANRHRVLPFLKNLRCTVKDNNLTKLSIEMGSIDHEKFPFASAMLMRTLIHTSLLHAFKSRGRQSVLDKLQKTQGYGGFKEILTLASNEMNNLFPHSGTFSTEMATCLRTLVSSSSFDYLNKAVHPSEIVTITKDRVKDIGESVRNMVEYLLDVKNYNINNSNAD